jgi:hypothetical protein
MLQNTALSVDNESVELLYEVEPNIAEELASEIVNGIGPREIVSFKVEQKIVNLETTNSVNVGGFANGNSNITGFKSRYLVVLFSNKIETITDSQNNIIRKRYGYGIGFTLKVKDVNTKIGFNYGVLAASTALGLSKIDYELNVYGVTDTSLLTYFAFQYR